MALQTTNLNAKLRFTYPGDISSLTLNDVKHDAQANNVATLFTALEYLQDCTAEDAYLITETLMEDGE